MAKPASGAAINPSDAQGLATSLTAAWAMLEGTGTTTADSTGNGHTLSNVGSNGTAWGTTVNGAAITFGGGGVANAALAVGTPILSAAGSTWSLAWRANTTASSGQLGMVCGDAGSTNDFIWMNPSTPAVSFRDHTASGDMSYTVSAANIATLSDYLLVRDGTAQTTALYRNGTLVASQAQASSKGGFNLANVGNAYTGTTFALAGKIECLYFWSGRALNATDATNLAANPYEFFGSAALAAGTLSVTGATATTVSLSMTAASGGTSPYSYQLQRAPDSSGSPGTYANDGSALTGQTSSATFTSSGLTPGTTYWYRVVVTDNVSATANSNAVSQATTAVSFTVSPSAIPANHSGNITLTLTGSGTSWTAGTPGTPTFALSGVANVIKVSQSVASATSATIVVTTGAGTGTLTVTGTSASSTVTVGAASFTLSPTSGATGVTQTVTATGTNTVWSQETASTLFSVAGGTGASLGSIVVTNNTSATFSLVNGSAAATLTVTANPTGATQTFSVTANTGSITLTKPVAYQTYQRNGSNQATIAISGTYTYSGGTVPSITATLAGSAPQTVTVSPSGGTFTGSVTFTVTPGSSNVQGNLVVAFSDGVGPETVANVGIGDLFMIAGQSNAEGRLSAAQSYTHATLKATLHKQGTAAGAWAELLDPTDPNTATGSYWPVIATAHMADQGVPIGFVTAADGSTGLVNPANWTKGGIGGSGGTEYTQAVTQASNAVSTSTGNQAIKGILWYQGEADASASVPRGQYLGRLLSMAWDFASDVSGAPKLLPVVIGYDTGDVDSVRMAICDAMKAGGNVVDGPGVYDLSNAVHPGSGGSMGVAATFAVPIAGRIWASMKAAWFGGSNVGHGPRVVSIQYDTARTSITVAFGQPLKTGLTFSTTPWAVTGNGVSATVSAVAYSGTDPNAVVLTLASAAAVPILVTFEQGATTAGNVIPLGADFTLPASLGTVNLPAEPFAAVRAAAGTSGGGGGTTVTVGKSGQRRRGR